MKKEDRKQRNLTEAEKRRSEQFEKTTQEMEQQGYTRHDLTIAIGKAMGFAVVLLIPLIIIGYGLFYLIHRRVEFSGFNIWIFVIVFIALVVIHELIHGVCWSIFAPNHFKDIEFGIMKSSFTPYCTCTAPLKKGHYLFGTVMPFLVLGIIPMIVGAVIGNPFVLLIGILMADSAAGDIMIILRVLGYRSRAKEVVYMDHPTEAGSVVFER
ncbi:MAG: DUF3267 domain-containing protein [Lachnospiraceae bacterium]|nr:DUF3267 domain-containing protein [Lachnospiraceae bacterium]